MSPEIKNDQVQTIDSLTALPNRAGLMQELEADALFNGGDFALVFVDVDGLKHTNDTLGHEAGDELIVETSQILSSGLRSDQENSSAERPNDSLSRDVFRLGGDEFVLKLNGVKTQDEVDGIINRLQDKLYKEGSNGGIKASMGGRPHRPGESGQELLADVDRIMYNQKSLHKDYDSQQKQHAERHKHRQQLEALPPTKFWSHIGATVVKRAAEKYSGVKIK